MSMNLFKVKKLGAFFLVGFIPFISFFCLMWTMADLMTSIIGFLITLFPCVFIAPKLIDHPMMKMIEGDGLLVLTFDSTGRIDPFIAKVAHPWLRGWFKGREVETIFDRDNTLYLTPPKVVEARSSLLGKTKAMLRMGAGASVPPERSHAPAPASVQDPDIEELVLRIPKAERDSVMFGFGSFPVLIYNKNMETFLSKTALSNMEKNAFIKHQVIYLNKKVEELTRHLRDFARYIVEQTKPKGGLGVFGKWWLWLMVFVVIIVLVMLVLPASEMFVAPDSGLAGGLISPR